MKEQVCSHTTGVHGGQCHYPTSSHSQITTNEDLLHTDGQDFNLSRTAFTTDAVHHDVFKLNSDFKNSYEPILNTVPI